ncbi:MAG: prenyltransferase/squalene oxidase repeat-containing protein [Solirubrobacteraceae bacterium]
MTIRDALVALSMTIVASSVYLAYPAWAATARDPKYEPNLDQTVRYIQNSQQENGGFAEPGTEPESDFTAWVSLALAAAGINPRDRTTKKQYWVGGHSAYTYLAEHAHNASLTTDFEREMLVVDAAGTSPYDFGGVDLAGEILKRQITRGINTGAFPHEAGSHTPGVNDTIFAILALSPIHEPSVEEAVARATRWLDAQQKCDGSWNWSYEARAEPCNPQERKLLPGEEAGEMDMTGAALEALNAVKHPDEEGQRLAFEYLREGETTNGGFVEFLTESEPNVASTAWVVQAMWSAGINPEEWLTHSGLLSEEPLGYLASMQQEDGHIRYRASQELNGMWMTAYVTPAFTGNPLPIPAVTYEELPAQPPEEPTSGNGGVSTNPGGGVISGGGGNGAKLFSRPQPKSKGHTPGGARQLKSQKHERPATHKLNPGRARKKPTPTLTIENHVRYVHRPLVTADHGPGNGNGGGGGGEPVVKGILLGNTSNASFDSALEPGAPGLHTAGAGGNETGWLTIGIVVALVLSVLAGMQLERRRPEVTP